MPPEARRPSARARSGRDPKGSEPRFNPLLAYEAILADARLNLTIFDRDLVVRGVSRAAAEFAGMSREEMIGGSLREAFPEEYVKDLERVISGETLEVEGRLSPELSAEEPYTHALMLPIRDEAGAVRGGMIVVVDVTDEKRAEELVEKLTFVDPLTDLPNRRWLSMTLGRALTRTKASRRRLALVWLNLDRFKDVNDALGHEAGDELLKAAGERLQESLRSNDLVARVAGDDFILLLPRINSRRHLDRLLLRIHDAFTEPFIVGTEPVSVTVSCGVALHPDGGSDARDLEEHAHTAMRAAKQLGGGACELYDEGFAEDSTRRMRLVGEIRAGMEQGRFMLHYQPQIELETMSVQAIEALARWDHPERGLLLPDEFIAFAEETALIVPLGRYLLKRAFAHYRGWHDALETPPRLAINVSAREFQRTDLCGELERLAEAAGIPLRSLEVEITETAVIADPKRAAEVCACLRTAGVSVALDDFGTGFSSLTHLRELPINRVKIDRSFVTSCLTDRSAAAILVAVTQLAHELGVEVVAEGVETQEQLEFLRTVGCDAAQGHYLSRPLPVDECTEYLLRAAWESVT